MCHIMPESIANLKRENNDLKSKVSMEEISRLKDLFQQQSSSAAPSAKEKSQFFDLFNFVFLKPGKAFFRSRIS